MSARHFILATAGHVDHGKSTLIRSLTGIDPDRLPEERARGMTIDLGFASFAPDPSLSIGIVDVPGHENFVSNMVAGVGAIDAALLVVAADDGWMPQTQEHLDILRYLNVHDGIIALTKIDRVDAARCSEVIAEIQLHIAETFLASASIIAVSVPNQIGITELSGAIATMFHSLPLHKNIGKPRLQIDRSFILRGTGRVVTGTLSGGSLERGQMVTVAPAQQGVKIRAVQSHHREIALAESGMRVALNIPELDGDTAWRGQTITLQTLAAAHDTLDVRLILDAGHERPRRGITLQVHHGTRSVTARLFPFAVNGLAQLRLESPLVAFVGDRLILRDAAQRRTIGGAIVLDIEARRHGMRSEPRQKRLADVASAIDDISTLVRATVNAAGVLKQDALLLQSNYETSAIQTAVAVDPTLRVVTGHAMTHAYWIDLLDRAARAIEAHHRDHPEQAGLVISALRPILQPASPALFDAIIDALADGSAGRGFVRMQSIIRATDHRPALPPRLLAAGQRLRAIFENHPLDPPIKSELAPDPLSQQALAFLKINGEIIELSPSIFIHASAFALAKTNVKKFLQQHRRATVTELKSAIGTTRRIAVPLLEKLDESGITRRSGDWRELKRQRPRP